MLWPHLRAHWPALLPRSDIKTDMQALLAGAIIVMIVNFLLAIYWSVTDHGSQAISLGRRAADGQVRAAHRPPARLLPAPCAVAMPAAGAPFQEVQPVWAPAHATVPCWAASPCHHRGRRLPPPPRAPSLPRGPTPLPSRWSCRPPRCEQQRPGSRALLNESLQRLELQSLKLTSA